MSATSVERTSPASAAARAILWGGLASGIGDIMFAFVFYGLRSGVSPTRVLQSVASGLLGTDSFQGGPATASLGLVLHFFIATSAAAVYYLASRKLTFLAGPRAALWGLAYGVVVYCVMNYVVIPLSAVPVRGSTPLTVLIPSVIGHMLLVGLPIAVATRLASHPASDR